MAVIQFAAYEVVEVRNYQDSRGEDVKIVTIGLGIGKPPPFPREKVEAKNLAEIAAAWKGYVEKAKASGLRLSLSAIVLAGRKPNGFDKANFGEHINV